MRGRKPLIGVTPQVGKLKGFEVDAKVVRLFPQYLEALLDEGAIPVILPFAGEAQDIIELVDAMDGFVFTGGVDIGPGLYVPGADPEDISQRDRFEVKLLHEVMAQNKPFLGICRGLQLINVVMGGTLYSDLKPEDSTLGLCHEQGDHLEQIYHHQVQVQPGTLLERICGCGQMGVNSLHHQAIDILGKDLEVQAISDDGLIEAIRVTTSFYGLAVQWHPELIFEKDACSRRLFRSFIRATGI
ncbi:gamma-glutamyl-gamma-aminobutyrate hydrolase family protein [Eubacterium aggregans]|uniref:gamma-glutamyl-gamma-aminobutyrate hydrolase family protein n=1 Tax=Eubacterium aggregans TaxID=81409 RepID=UPI0023F2CBF1|nr:gamma-glutamyl-gamma-aminobutyrate hydrolase family protein [Eubacterium aggregans]MDD4691184.1 gamma-glutamyl-gamma-aminobutyrate hydrolase family protein [Eubacterium aggregans]